MTDDTMSGQDKDRSILVEQLIQESGTSLTHEEVLEIFDEEFARLSEGANLVNYLHLLTFRATLQRLRD